MLLAFSNETLICLENLTIDTMHFVNGYNDVDDIVRDTKGCN